MWLSAEIWFKIFFLKIENFPIVCPNIGKHIRFLSLSWFIHPYFRKAFGNWYVWSLWLLLISKYSILINVLAEFYNNRAGFSSSWLCSPIRCIHSMSRNDISRSHFSFKVLAIISSVISFFSSAIPCKRRVSSWVLFLLVLEFPKFLYLVDRLYPLLIWDLQLSYLSLLCLPHTPYIYLTRSLWIL